MLLRKLDLAGEPQGPIASLTTTTTNWTERGVTLGWAYQQIAVLWSSGPYEFDCEDPTACSHRDRTKFVLLDPLDLAPRSGLVEIVRDQSFPNLTPKGDQQLGWFRDVTVLQRDESVLLTAIVSDTDNDRVTAASASLRCHD